MPEEGGRAAGGGSLPLPPPERLLLKETDKAPEDLRFCESFEAAHSNHELSGRIASSLDISRPPLRMDSQVKYGVMARGDADIYLRLPHAQVYMRPMCTCPCTSKVTDMKVKYGII